MAHGAAKRDLVQLHGAIALELERHTVPLAFVNVFRPALRIAHLTHGEECRFAVADAVQAHINEASKRTD